MKTLTTSIAEPIVIRKNEEIAHLISFDENGHAILAKGSKLNPDECAAFAVSKVDSAASASLQAVGIVRLARMLPDVETGRDKENKPVMQEAFDYVCGRIAELCKTQSTWSNVKGLIECADIADANNLKSSPFAVKEALGYLRKVGAIGAVKDAPLKLTAGDSVADKLKSGVGVNAVRVVLSEAKKAKNEEAAKGNGPVPFPNRATAAKVEPVKVATPDENIAHALNSLKNARSYADKVMEAGKGAEMKAALSKCEELASLATLAGLVK